MPEQQQHPPTLEQRSFLAHSFIPQHLREVNTCLAATVLETTPVPIDWPRLPGAVDLVPPVPLQQQRPHPTFPNRVSDANEVYYAVQQQQSWRESSSSSTSQRKRDAHLLVCSNLNDYKIYWEQLLHAERKELLLRFEGKSQYSQNYTIQHDVPTLQLGVPGIADTSPPLLVGDTVLLRPVGKSRLRKHNGNWSKRKHTIEIRSKVLAVRRGRGTVDRVVATWFPSPDASVALFAGLKQSRSTLTMNVRFVPAPTKHARCLTALDWLCETYKYNMSGDDDHEKQAISFLFPEESPVVPPLPDSYVLPSVLNHKQSDFCRMVLARTHWPSTDAVRSPMILTGPAGTGKTKTMLAAVRLVLEQNPRSRILVCTPSHTAANVVTRRLGENNYLGTKQMLRLVDFDRPVETIPIDILHYCHQKEDDGGFIIPLPAVLLQFRVIVCTCSDAYLLYAVGLTNQQLRTQRQWFRQHLTTMCAGFQLQVELPDADQPHFTHLFVDEAGQASEPESLIPLSVVLDVETDSRKVEVALVGDPRQLAATAYVQPTPSLMERLLLRPVRCLGGGREHMLGDDLVEMTDWLRYSFRQNGAELLSVFLTLNYRGHPSFLMVPSSLFYSDKLQSMAVARPATSWCTLLRQIEELSTPVVPVDFTDDAAVPPEVRYQRQLLWPIHFRGVIGTDTTTTTVESGLGADSWTNQEEADVVVRIVETLAASRIATQSIGVMSPFRGQVVAIRKSLRLKGLAAVNVGTVEDYQSVEYHVVVLSLTRSTAEFLEHDMENQMGIFGGEQYKRSNVAMTRAEFMFIVVGNPEVMMKDSVWRQFLLFCRRNGLQYGQSIREAPLLSWDTGKQIQSTWSQQSGTDSKKQDDNVVVVSTIERLLRNQQ